MNRQILYRLYWKIESIIVPGLQYSQILYSHTLKKILGKKKRWLDLGCGCNIFPDYMSDHERTLIEKSNLLVGLDYDHPSLKRNNVLQNKLRGDITYLPFSDNSFDLITANMVFEHLEKPEAQLREISRILFPDGILVFHTPNKLSYSTILARLIPESIKGKIIYLLQKRKDEDVFPAHYRINSIRNLQPRFFNRP